MDKKNIKIQVDHTCPVTELESQVTEIFHFEDYKLGLIKKNMTILDVGANIGLSVKYFQEWAKKIYALEPEATCFFCLEKNTKQFKNVERFNVGLGYKTGSINMYSENEDLPPQTMMPSDTMINNNPYMEMVKVMRIDDFFEQEKIKHIDLMKIDTEGAEYFIFPSDGFKKVASKIDYIIGEAHYKTSIPQTIPVMLKEYGFKTKILPRKNSLFFTHYNKEEGMEERTFSVSLPTMFFAYR